MSAPREPDIIAEHGGLVVAERGPEILVVDRGSPSAEITAFVLMTVTLVFGGFGIAALVLFGSGAMPASSAPLGAGSLAIGIVAAVGALFTVRSVREQRRRPLSTLTAVAVFDRAQRVYRDGNGVVVAPLDQVRFARQMQMTSSSAKLVAITPWGTHVLKRGNPFGGGVGNLDEVLTRAVHGGHG